MKRLSNLLKFLVAVPVSLVWLIVQMLLCFYHAVCIGTFDPGWPNTWEWVPKQDPNNEPMLWG